MSAAYFVTGTDTGVGKTLVACALLRAFAARGMRVIGMKPVAAGTDAAGRNEDVEALIAAGNVTITRERVNPYLLRDALAPHIAAQRVNVVIDIERIARGFESLRAQADVVVVEGAGGFRVPLDETRDSADLASRLGVPLILVVGLRLGCINHALLSEEAIRARGLKLAGWVANQIDPDMDCVSENVAALEARIAAPLLGFVQYRHAPDIAAIAAALRLPQPGA